MADKKFRSFEHGVDKTIEYWKSAEERGDTSRLQTYGTWNLIPQFSETNIIDSGSV
jgi:hypothetical protein